MSRLLAPLALLAVAAAAAADTKVPSSGLDDVRRAWPDLDRYRVAVEVSGAFSREGRDDVNLINGPPIARPVPPQIDIPTAHVEAMNREVKTLPLAILAAMRVHAEAEPPRSPREPVGKRMDPHQLHLSLVVAGDHGMGGRRGGLDVTIRLLCERLSDQPSVRTLVTVPVMASVPAQLAALRSTLEKGILQLLRALRAAMQHPASHVTLQFDLAPLAEPQRRYVVASLLPCAASLASSDGHQASWEMKSPLDDHFRVEFRYVPPESPRDFVQKYKARLEAEIGPHGKHRCSLWRSPLEGRHVTVLELETRASPTPILFVRFEPSP